MNRLILFGVAGSGKGTIAKELVDKLGWEHVSTGDLLRSHIKNKTPIGIQIEDILRKGNLAPNSLVSDVVDLRLKELEAENKSYMLDGSPRTIYQAERLLWMEKYIVINLYAPDDLIRERLIGREFCSTCGASFHVSFRKPKIVGICDRCNSKLVKRNDDSPEIVEQRIRVYYSETAPVLDYYRSRCGVVEVDATRTPAEISTYILNKIKA